MFKARIRRMQRHHPDRNKSATTIHRCGARWNGCYVQRFLAAALFAATACCFFWSAALALEFFCEDFLFTAFGDLSPIIICRLICR